MAIFSLSLLMFSLVYTPKVFALQCYSCMSHVSWEDCVKHQSVTKCDPPLNTCLKAHRMFLKMNEQKTQEFYKSCFHSSECSKKSCVDTDTATKGRWCDIECCNTTMCNTGVTPWAKKHLPPETLKQVGEQQSHVTYVTANRISVSLMLVTGLILRHVS